MCPYLGFCDDTSLSEKKKKPISSLKIEDSHLLGKYIPVFVYSEFFIYRKDISTSTTQTIRQSPLSWT